MSKREPDSDRVQNAARQAQDRELAGRAVPEPSLARRFGQIGVLGWIIILPTLGGVFLGHWLDNSFDSGITFAAALLFAGAVFGFWLSWRWMHQQ